MLMRPTFRAAAGRRFLRPIWSCSEWGLHGRHVTMLPCELLPHNFNLTTALPVSAECFCCTFPIVTYAGRYPASSPCGARTFLMSPEGTRDCPSYPNDIITLQTDLSQSLIQKYPPHAPAFYPAPASFARQKTFPCRNAPHREHTSPTMRHPAPHDI